MIVTSRLPSIGIRADLVVTCSWNTGLFAFLLLLVLDLVHIELFSTSAIVDYVLSQHYLHSPVPVAHATLGG